MLRRTPGFWLDAAPALAFAAFLLAVSPVAGDAPLHWWAFGLLAAAGLGAGLIRRRPLHAYALMLTCTCVYLAADQPSGPIHLAPLIGALGLVASRPPRVWVPAAVVAFVGSSVGSIGEDVSPALALGAALWLAAALGFHLFLGLRRVQAEQSRESALSEERLRIAREVHDVVGHSLAAISLQAGVAERLIDRNPEGARDAVTEIRGLAGQALDEVRGEIGLLRGAGELRPASGARLAAVPGLVDAIRDAGAAVELDLDPALTAEHAVPDAVGAATFRIVQEALTNVVRHAGTHASAHVNVARAGDALEVEVLDDGRHAPAEPAPGNGLRGMRERAAALGGSFTAGAAEQGGFRVFARLPAEEP